MLAAFWLTESKGLPPPFLYVCWLPAAEEVVVDVVVVEDCGITNTPVVLEVVVEVALDAEVDEDADVDADAEVVDVADVGALVAEVDGAVVEVAAVFELCRDAFRFGQRLAGPDPDRNAVMMFWPVVAPWQAAWTNTAIALSPAMQVWLQTLEVKSEPWHPAIWAL